MGVPTAFGDAAKCTVMSQDGEQTLEVIGEAGFSDRKQRVLDAGVVRQFAASHQPEGA